MSTEALLFAAGAALSMILGLIGVLYRVQSGEIANLRKRVHDLSSIAQRNGTNIQWLIERHERRHPDPEPASED